MNKAILVSIDGLRSDAIKNARTPMLDYLIKKGAYSGAVKTVTPSITLPSHFSMFTSLNPYSHGVLTNTALPDISALSQSLYAHIKQHAGVVSSFYSWEHLRNLSLPGTLDHTFMHRLYQEKDLITLAKAAIGHIITHCPDFCFIYFEWLDLIGHESGWMSGPYLKALELTDQALELIVDGLNQFSDRGGYHLIVTSDHGGKEHHHLENVPEITNVPLIVWGRDVRENHWIESPVSLLDISPTISKILGIPPHFAWEGKPVSEVFIAGLENNSIPRVAWDNSLFTPDSSHPEWIANDGPGWKG